MSAAAKQALVAFVSGVVFAVGLGIGGMTLPSKVIGFLDLFGEWDPSLAFVMGGAVVVYGVGYRLVSKSPRPLFADRFRLPTRHDIDGRLLAGAALFGIGWGLGGYCPGPALTSLVTLKGPVLVFNAAMIGGMFVFKLVERWRRPMGSTMLSTQSSKASLGAPQEVP